MTTSTRAAARRQITIRLGLLAAVMLVAGGLPWVTAGPLAARLIAVPLLLAGLLAAWVVIRVRALPAGPVRTPRPAGTAGTGTGGQPAGCGGCACGGAGCAAEDAAERATGSAAGAPDREAAG